MSWSDPAGRRFVAVGDAGNNVHSGDGGRTWRRGSRDCGRTPVGGPDAFLILDGPDGRAYAFPSPDDLAAREPDQLRALGFSRQKAQAIIELARAVAGGRLDLDELEALDDATAVMRLRALRGVGRWTAEYVLLRGMGRLHVFPGDDVGARNNLQRWLGLLEPLDYEGVRRVLAKSAPFQGLVYLHLLLRAQELQSERFPRATQRSRQPGHGMLR